MPRNNCPHGDVRFCPLYVALHDPKLVVLGCDDGRLAEGGCAVTRGMDFEAARIKIAVAAPQLTARLKFLEDAENTKSQRSRNLHQIGRH